MGFTQPELDNIAAQAIDYHYRRQPFAQTIQSKPLLRTLESKRKNFPGGKEKITLPAKGAYDLATGLVGYDTDDTINYDTIVGVKRAEYEWKEMSGGWTMTHTELKIDGITVSNSANSTGMRRHSRRELTVLSNILEEKLYSFDEGIERSMNDLLWGDGTGDAKALAGVQYFLTTTPAVGTTGGIDRAVDTWWQHRYGVVDIGTNPAAGSVPEILPLIQTEMRQLRRYGGRPDIALCGSDWLTRMESELLAKGYYTQQGWSRSGDTNFMITDPRWGDLVFEYDPSLDDLGLNSECFMMDTGKLYIQSMEAEWGKDHNPARPHDVYALFRSRTYTGQLVCSQLNAHGRYHLQETNV